MTPLILKLNVDTVNTLELCTLFGFYTAVDYSIQKEPKLWLVKISLENFYEPIHLKC